MKSTYHGKSKWDSIKEEDKSNFSIAAMIMGIVALVFSCIEALSFLSVLALLLSIYSMIGEHNRNKGMAITGLTTSIVACLLSVIVSVFSVSFNNSKEESVSEKTIENVDITDFSLEEYMLYNENGVEIICKKGNRSGENFSIGFYAENNSNSDINISLSGIAINNISFSEDDLCDYVYEDIMSGDKSNFSIDIDVETLTDNGIENITRIEPMFVLYEGDSDGKQIDDVLFTTADDEEYVEISGGHDVYSDDNFDIMYLGNEENHFKFSIYNKKGEYLDYYIDKCSINGYSFDLTESETNVFDKPIFPETYSIFEIIIDDDFVYKNSIEDIEKIEFKMYADSDATTFTTGSDIKTKKITVEFEK